MAILKGINNLNNICFDISPIGDFFMGREQVNTKNPYGFVMVERLEPLYAEVRNKKSLKETMDIFLDIARFAFKSRYGQKRIERGLCELADREGIDVQILSQIFGAAKLLGKEKYRQAVYPSRFTFGNMGIKYRDTNGKVHFYSGCFIFPYSGDFMRISQDHAELTPTPFGLKVRDLGSSHGTSIDGKLISIDNRGKAEAPFGSVISLSPNVFEDEYSFRIERN